MHELLEQKPAPPPPREEKTIEHKSLQEQSINKKRKKCIAKANLLDLLNCKKEKTEPNKTNDNKENKIKKEEVSIRRSREKKNTFDI